MFLGLTIVSAIGPLAAQACQHESHSHITARITITM
jgi:hypothetical protein